MTSQTFSNVSPLGHLLHKLTTESTVQRVCQGGGTTPRPPTIIHKFTTESAFQRVCQAGTPLPLGHLLHKFENSLQKVLFRGCAKEAAASPPVSCDSIFFYYSCFSLILLFITKQAAASSFLRFRILVSRPRNRAWGQGQNRFERRLHYFLERR